MCIGVGIAGAIGAIASVASAGIGAVAAIQQGQAAAAMEEYRAEVARKNAYLDEERAADANERGIQAQQNKRMEIARLKAAHTVGFAQGGIDVTSGSSLDTQLDIVALGEIDALTVRANAARESYDYRVSAANKRAQSEMHSMAAKNYEQAGYLNAFASGIGALGGIANAMGGMGGGSASSSALKTSSNYHDTAGRPVSLFAQRY